MRHGAGGRKEGDGNVGEAGGAKAPGELGREPGRAARADSSRLNVPAYSDLTAIFRGRALEALGTYSSSTPDLSWARIASASTGVLIVNCR